MPNLRPGRGDFPAPRGPAEGEIEAFGRVVIAARVRRAFIEKHADVRAERGLRFHGLAGTKKHRGAIDVVLEAHTFLRHLPQLGQREDLKPAGIRQDRPIPGHESMQPTEMGHHFHPRPDEEMIRIAENNLRPERAEFLG